MKATLMAAAVAFLLGQILLAQQFTPPGLPGGASGKGEAVDCEVVKVYSLEDDGASYRAYGVKYKNGEVVATDSMGTSSHKVGDKIKVIVARVELPLPTGKIKSISFSVLPTGLPKKP